MYTSDCANRKEYRLHIIFTAADTPNMYKYISIRLQVSGVLAAKWTTGLSAGKRRAPSNCMISRARHMWHPRATCILLSVLSTILNTYTIISVCPSVHRSTHRLPSLKQGDPCQKCRCKGKEKKAQSRVGQTMNPATLLKKIERQGLYGVSLSVFFPFDSFLPCKCT